MNECVCQQMEGVFSVCGRLGFADALKTSCAQKYKHLDLDKTIQKTLFLD